MQRRLTIALVATALVSIVLVGFGVLAMAQLGARSNAEGQVSRGLNVVSGFLADTDRPRRQVEVLLSGSRNDFGLDLLEVVAIAPDGSVEPFTDRRRPGSGAAADFPDVDVSDDHVERLAEGDSVLLISGNRVIGLRTVEVNGVGGFEDRSVTIMAGRQVRAVTRQTVAWFLLSSAIVIAGALVAGLLLAARLARPIRNIQAATTAIAAGNLDVRVEPTGSDEVADLGHAVNEMAADLQRSKALDRQFLMSVSHDLRTPLTAISGYAEGLRDGAITDPTSAGEVIGNHARRLDLLVGDLLDLARLDANRFRLDVRRFDLAVLAGRTVAGLAQQAEQHGLTLVAAGPPSLAVVADPDRTAQAIGNLIDNAVKFARSRILVELADDGRGWATVSVRDDGPGIPERDLAHIFDRLYTGKAQPERAENPTGLGLAIVRELAQAMGGSVTAANNADGGASISMSVPMERSDPAGSPPPPGEQTVTGRVEADQPAAEASAAGASTSDQTVLRPDGPKPPVVSQTPAVSPTAQTSELPIRGQEAPPSPPLRPPTEPNPGPRPPA